MGQYNSSEHRVRPIFDALRARDTTGRTWLAPLLAAPRRPGRSAFVVDPGIIGCLEHAAWTSHVAKTAGWQPHEHRLPAPHALLERLIDTITAPHSGSAWGKGETGDKRRLLSGGDEATRREAHRLLTNPSRAGGWEVLEGPSSPDVYLKTATAIIVIEGKFTERKPTDRTTWQASRSQMLRHIDAAWDEPQRSGRTVYGFFIVEDGEAAGWRDAVTRTVSATTIEGSLAHRDPDTRAAIADAFLGLTTWATICSATGLQVALLKSGAQLRASRAGGPYGTEHQRSGS